MTILNFRTSLQIEFSKIQLYVRWIQRRRNCDVLADYMPYFLLSFQEENSPVEKGQKRAIGRSRVCPNFYCS